MTNARGIKRKIERKRNYDKGNFMKSKSMRGIKYDDFDRWLIMNHTFSDREVAKMLRRSSEGVQALRWRMKNDYKKLYGDRENGR